MEEKQGMPIMLKDKPVIIKAVRLRAYDGSYIVPHEDKQNVKLFKHQDANMVMPKKTEWKLIWSGEDNICSFKSIYGKALSIRGNFGIFRPRLYLEPWPVLDGAADWKLQINKTSSDGKVILAMLKPARHFTFAAGSVELGSFGVTMYGYVLYYTLVPSPGWTIEVIESSRVSEDNNSQQHRDHLTQPMNITFVYANQETLIADSQIVGGDYCNSGHNKNYSGTQNSGASGLR